MMIGNGGDGNDDGYHTVYKSNDHGDYADGYNSLFGMLVLNHLVIVILTAHGFFFSKTLIFSKCFSRS